MRADLALLVNVGQWLTSSVRRMRWKLEASLSLSSYLVLFRFALLHDFVLPFLNLRTRHKKEMVSTTSPNDTLL